MDQFEQYLIDLFEALGIWAIIISLLINIIISVLGVVPSVFITAANIAAFGLPLGIAVSIAGEALGAIASFILYRLGIRKFRAVSKAVNHCYLDRLRQADGWRAFWFIISLRILPFVPSGLVTFASAMSKVNLLLFTLASTLGKVPALLIESLSIYGFLNASLPVKAGLTVAGLTALILPVIYYKQKN